MMPFVTEKKCKVEREAFKNRNVLLKTNENLISTFVLSL